MMQKLPSSSSEAMDSYVKALEEERKKIMVFERELPLSLHIVTQAIESCRRQKEQQHVGCSEEILTSEGPVLEEFIPLKPANSSSLAEEISTDHDKNHNGDEKKPDWLRSVQLSNQETEPPTQQQQDVLQKPIAINAKRVGAGGAFRPFEREKNVKGVAPSSCTSENNINNGREEKEKEKEKEKEGHSSDQRRKSRRCWSPELHRSFLNALEQLGGSHAATPKQIRELMKVDELTNDEVKSHLQKYRLHTRRPTTGTIHSSSNSNHPTHQIVFVGGLWMPPPEYTAASQPAIDKAGAPFNGVYAPVASLPSEYLGSEQVQIKQQLKRSPTGPLNSEGRSSRDDNSDRERTNSDSSATASSSQTTTGSPSSSK